MSLYSTHTIQSGSVFGSKESSAKVQIDAWQHRLWVRHLLAGMCVKDRTVRTPPKSSVIRDPSRSTAQSVILTYRWNTNEFYMRHCCDVISIFTHTLELQELAKEYTSSKAWKLIHKIMFHHQQKKQLCYSVALTSQCKVLYAAFIKLVYILSCSNDVNKWQTAVTSITCRNKLL